MDHINNQQPDLGVLELFIRQQSGALGFIENWNTNIAGKQAIGKYIAQHLIKEDVLVFDAGSTSYEIAKAVVHHSAGAQRVITNNLAISLYLASCKNNCMLLGGDIDPYHFCTLPKGPQIDLPLNVSWQGILTAAAVSITDTGIGIRGRKPDQFSYKQALLKSATTKVVAIDHTKWTLPFDGQNEFHVFESNIHIVVDTLPEIVEGSEVNIRDLCRKFGYNLHVAAI